jgi:hypothetical protein
MCFMIWLPWMLARAAFSSGPSSESVAGDGVGEEPAHPLTLAASAAPRIARWMVPQRIFAASVWREW